MDEAERIKREKLRELQKRASQGKEGQGAGIEYPSSPLEVNDSTLAQTVGGYPLVVVDFYADWCQPCKMMAPVLQELAQELKGRLVVAKVNVDQNPLSARKYQAMSIPTMVIFRDGKPVDRITGALPKQALRARVEKHLA